MPTPARVVVVPGEPGPLQIREVQLPDPGPYQVVVKQFASGICHSQLHQMHRPRSGGVNQILGHESTGVVLAVGKEVKHVKEGDHVMVTWVPRDGENESRRAEGIALDIGGGETARTGNFFTWADNTIADEQYIVKIGKDERTDVTAIIGCAVMTGAGAVYYTAGVKKGESVAIFGVGRRWSVGYCRGRRYRRGPDHRRRPRPRKARVRQALRRDDWRERLRSRPGRSDPRADRKQGRAGHARPLGCGGRLRLRLHRRAQNDGADHASCAFGRAWGEERRHGRSRGRAPDAG